MRDRTNRPREQGWRRGRYLTSIAAALATMFALAAAASGHAPSASAAPLSHSMPLSVMQATERGDAACAQPPAGVDLTTLSPTQLAYYGLQQRPSDMQRLARWRLNLSHAKHRFCAVTPAPAGLHATSQESSLNWAGNVGINGGYYDIYAEWYVPGVSSSPHSAYSVTWVGIGGDGNDGGGNLIQAGTEQDTNSSGAQFYYAWYEDWPHDPTVKRLSNYTIGPGDLMYVEVNQGGNYEQYWIDDYYSNSYASPTEYGYLSNESTAEWIEERPGNPPNYTTLANFGSVTFYDSYANRSTSEQPVGQLPHNYLVMCRDGWWTCGPFSTQLAHPGGISSDGTYFTVYHDAS